MAIITDIKKLRPELLDLSVAELHRRRDEIDMAISEKAAKEESERRAALVDEAGTRTEAVLDNVKWLHDNGFLAQRLVEALTRSDGQFNPSTFLRKPRAEDTVTRPKSDKPKRVRRRRDPQSGELI